jgi:type II pantothenate kinase
VSAELADAVADVDLLVLEGMGRAIETNLYAKFTVDCLKLGMIKHPEVAACLGGRLYDCVCKFDRAGTLGAINAALS